MAKRSSLNARNLKWVGELLNHEGHLYTLHHESICEQKQYKHSCWLKTDSTQINCVNCNCIR